MLFLVTMVKRATLLGLRYYTTFKVRKVVVLQINTFLQKTTTFIGLQAE